LSRAAGLQHAHEVDGLALSPLSAAVPVGIDNNHLLALPELGPLKLADTVYLMYEGPRAMGLLFARDRLARSCLLTLNLKPKNNDLAWQATVVGVTREGERSPDGVGASFLFHTRHWRETKWSRP